MAIEQDIFWKFIEGRRSIRRYQRRAIEPALLEKLLQAASWAPSAHNRQPWRFCVITCNPAKKRLSHHMGEQWRRDLHAAGAEPAFVEQRVAISHARLTGAAALIVASVTLEDMDVYTNERHNEAEWLMAVQSVALACQNLLLAAHVYGLGACWMCAPLFVPHLVRDVLELPPQWHPQALITVGYPAEGHSAAEKSKERQPLESRVIWR